MRTTKQIRNIKASFLGWCGKRNDFYTNLLGDGDTFTNGEVIRVNAYAAVGIAVILSAEALVELFIKNILLW